jgi:hypothetical protein
MSEIKTGGPAFPGYGESGMTLRDYFAAKVLQGLIADPTMHGDQSYFAKHAYDYADAMIKAREAK